MSKSAESQGRAADKPDSRELRDCPIWLPRQDSNLGSLA